MLAKAKKFADVRGFPKVVGGTHIPIKAPSGADEPCYVNRKQVHSLNVQVSISWFVNIMRCRFR